MILAKYEQMCYNSFRKKVTEDGREYLSGGCDLRM